MESIGQRIENLRYKNNLTLEDLSKHLGISKTAIRKYETGDTKNIKYENIEKLADLFNVSTDYLLTGKQEETPEDKFIQLLIDKTLENKIKWIDLGNNDNTHIKFKDKTIKMSELKISLDNYIDIWGTSTIKITSISDTIIFIIVTYRNANDIDVQLVYGKNTKKLIGIFSEKLVGLYNAIFDMENYLNKIELDNLIDDLENL